MVYFTQVVREACSTELLCKIYTKSLAICVKQSDVEPYNENL